MCSSGVKAAAAPVIPAVAGRRNCLRRHGCQGPAEIGVVWREERPGAAGPQQ
ncbi:hypothetical protein T484DRAFT_1882792, partial [Baffinella frigidus]